MSADFPIHNPADLMAAPGFHACLGALALALLSERGALPREVRYLASLRKWLLSQATLALHFEHRNDPSRPPLTPGALQGLLPDTGIAGRNTITAFLQEMRHYGLARPLPDGDRRRHALLAAPAAEALILRWLALHLAALDRVDNADRQARILADHDLLCHVQPTMLRLLLREQGWLHPSPGIALFSGAEAGSHILHHIAARTPAALQGPEFNIGHLTARDLATQYLTSQTHTSRLLTRAAQAGYLRWTQNGRRGDCMVATGLAQEYRRWQAIKFAALSRAFAWAAGRGRDPVLC